MHFLLNKYCGANFIGNDHSERNQCHTSIKIILQSLLGQQALDNN